MEYKNSQILAAVVSEWARPAISQIAAGNLMRLPLGVNRKNPTDPCFFVDRTVAYSHLGPADPQKALDKEKAWT